MATLILKVPVADGSDEYVEVEAERRDLGDIELVAAGDGRAPLAAVTLTSSLEKVLPAVRTVVAGLRAAASAPDEISVELGLTVGGETGLIFTKGTAEATFKVNLTWRRAEAPPPARSAVPEAPAA
ncbi:CU044_2847 family protein [Micromonospora peucetia]|uniref:Trypsin-co-occurring domain-containing protein n=1 Tax=Micromonospora peucetia TaxID=47871 RepID=A0A1C6W2F9_9ACTN|nr:CU044_2847 family protein [Micromonospora peucetia]MCX4390975.1 CU044_2847 family protein [Micromonospora peucetia]SCL72350.1 hypothetical protein GA0070608_4958 [Micromonospora peucetia]